MLLYRIGLGGYPTPTGEDTFKGRLYEIDFEFAVAAAATHFLCHHKDSPFSIIALSLVDACA